MEIVIGHLLALELDPIVFVPAVILGIGIESVRSAVIGGIAVLAAVLALKMPAISLVAAKLDKAGSPYIVTGLWYAAAVSAIVGMVIIGRRIVGGRWPWNC